MSNSAKLAMVAACAGDPTRANMLLTLVDGRAFTAGELSRVAGVTAQTASGHLARLVEAGLVRVAKQGRHRYYRLASPQVGQMLEGILVVAGTQPGAMRLGPGNEALRFARSCYDHLAGRLGVAIAQSLVDAGRVVLDDDGGEVTPAGREFFSRLGLDLTPQRPHRAFCRPCLDWSERRYHIAGTLGTRIAQSCFQHGWLRRRPGNRVVELTPAGRKNFHDVYGIDLSSIGEKASGAGFFGIMP